METLRRIACALALCFFFNIAPASADVDVCKVVKIGYRPVSFGMSYVFRIRRGARCHSSDVTPP
jgi:hypothetical protein